jgi:hypothetical protein
LFWIVKIIVGLQSKMGNSQSISMLTYGVDGTVLPIDPLNVKFKRKLLPNMKI